MLKKKTPIPKKNQYLKKSNMYCIEKYWTDLIFYSSSYVSCLRTLTYVQQEKDNISTNSRLSAKV